jgi:hypothetical protein
VTWPGTGTKNFAKAGSHEEKAKAISRKDAKKTQGIFCVLLRFFAAKILSFLERRWSSEKARVTGKQP